ncbi:MAG: hypothetical protein MRY83_03985, partial [Flavobacteriales bacterium]|nr:hypothetical protein [Flavobacteriales bacterium]
ITSTSFTLPSANNNTNFKDIFFHDDINGYIVGNSGALLKSKDFIYPNNDIYTASLSSGGFQAMDIDDNLNGQLDPADMDINTIHFSSRTKGFVAGKYNGAGTTPKGYNRTIEDGAGLISQRFWYDRLGRTALSQNTKQYNNNKFTYTRFDELGRTYESGAKSDNKQGTQFDDIFGAYVQGYYNPNAINDNNLIAFLDNNSGARTEVSQTFYDVEFSPITSQVPSSFDFSHIRNRTSTTTYEKEFDNDPTTFDHGTHYSYDIHGNTTKILQDFPKLGFNQQRFKSVEYEFDLVSSNSNKIDYQKGAADQFQHRYTYDQSNRSNTVKTSDNNLIFSQDAKYQYYLHGQKARVELGENQVQGCDYVYTLQGWLKALNSNTLNEARDPGQDGAILNNNPNQIFARDAAGFTPNYYKGVYSPISNTKWITNNRFEAQIPNSSNLKQDRFDLYQGNISSITTTLRDSATYNPLPMAFAYQYDELDRILYANGWTNLDLATNTWLSGSTNLKSYRNKFTYDRNGNIENQERRNSNGQVIDQLTYHYRNSANNERLENKLYYVTDATPIGDFSTDIDDQTTYNDNTLDITEGSHYRYTEIGELLQNPSEAIDTIIWRCTDGKIKEIRRTSGSKKSNLVFDYDARGRRVAKHIYTSSGTWLRSVYYVRDGVGNVLAVYEKNTSKGGVIQVGGSSKILTYKLLERYIYGDDRIGSFSKEVSLVGGIKDEIPHEKPGNVQIGNGNKLTTVDKNSPIKGGSVKKGTIDNCIGLREYEMVNQVGNIITVVSDKKIAIDDTQDGNVDFYMPDILTATDYSPFGVPLDKRNYVNRRYRYSFQGQEHDDEIQGAGNALNYTYRMHDPRLGRFLSVDPLHQTYPHNSPYAFSENRVTNSREIEGLESDDNYRKPPEGKGPGYWAKVPPYADLQWVEYPVEQCEEVCEEAVEETSTPMIIIQQNPSTDYQQTLLPLQQKVIAQQQDAIRKEYERQMNIAMRTPVIQQDNSTRADRERAKAMMAQMEIQKNIEARKALDPVGAGVGHQLYTTSPIWMPMLVPAAWGTMPARFSGLRNAFTYRTAIQGPGAVGRLTYGQRAYNAGLAVGNDLMWQSYGNMIAGQPNNINLTSTFLAPVDFGKYGLNTFQQGFASGYLSSQFQLNTNGGFKVNSFGSSVWDATQGAALGTMFDDPNNDRDEEFNGRVRTRFKQP